MDSMVLHPFHFLYPLNPTQGRGGWSLSQLSLGERQVTPWTGHQSTAEAHRDEREKQSSMLTLTPRDNLESPIKLTCMFLDGGRKGSTERPGAGIRTLLVWGDGNHHAAPPSLNGAPQDFKSFWYFLLPNPDLDLSTTELLGLHGVISLVVPLDKLCADVLYLVFTQHGAVHYSQIMQWFNNIKNR